MHQTCVTGPWVKFIHVSVLANYEPDVWIAITYQSCLLFLSSFLQPRSLVAKLWITDDAAGPQSTPLVLMTSPSLPLTISIACLRATARDLNAASDRWWSFSPFSTSTCKVMPAVWLKLCRQCGIICVVRLPILASLKPKVPQKYGREEISTTERARASSRGA